MQPSNIMTASNEYRSRPKDERFATLQELIIARKADREICQEAVYNLRDLEIVPSNHGSTGILLQSPKGQATLTNYSFGQLCSTLKAPARFMAELPPANCAADLTHRMHEWAPVGTTANILIRDRESDPYPVVRACTSETYGRVWDHSLYSEVDRYFGDGRKSANSAGVWQSPPVWPGRAPGGQYAGDRDSFVIRVDGGSIVSDPRGWQAKGRPDGGLYRGIMIRNSEVGLCSITIDCVLFDKICGNHILWGAVIDRTYRRRHYGTKVTRDVLTELNTLAWKFNTRTEETDLAIIRALVQHEIASTKDAVIDELRKLGATKEQATQAYETAEQKESQLSPRSYWGIAAGMTRNSQASGYQDDRLDLDQLAVAVLKKGRQLVTV